MTAFRIVRALGVVCFAIVVVTAVARTLDTPRPHPRLAAGGMSAGSRPAPEPPSELAFPIGVMPPPERVAATSSRPTDPSRGADPARAPILKHVKESAHYRVSCDISTEAAEEAAALLERAWPVWCRRFGLDETYEAGPGVFSVRLYPTTFDLDAALRKDLGYPVNCLGFVDFMSYRMFALRHSDHYERRRILLHEGMHQFLYRLVGSTVAERLPRWYDEGCAHESEKHRLEGDTLELYQHTGGAYSGQLQTARRVFTNGEVTIGGLIRLGDNRSEDVTRACGWALVHYCRSAASADDTAWFRDFESAFHSGSWRLCDEVRTRLGDAGEGRMQRRLVAWLDSIAAKPESR